MVIIAPETDDEPIEIIESVILPGEKSRVTVLSWSGKLNLHAQVADAGCLEETCWQDWDIGRKTLETGSVRLVVRGEAFAELELSVE